ncbi:MAG TPA: peptidylprolyl isomerase [Bacteroidales bacterium]|nr:peptidylprolyl isomerase [Bacteroidales bacterium]
MAVLQKIRNRAGVLVIIFVGVALFLFIIDPSTFQGLFNKNSTDIAEINGEEVDYKEFMEFYKTHSDFLKVAQRKENLEASEDEQIREQAWNDIMQKYLMEPYYEEVGLSVSEEEMKDMLYGANIHYIILQNFTNQQTGQVDTASIRRFFDTADDDPNYHIISEYWKQIIKKDRISTKYNNMVGKGFYTPKKMAEMEYKEKNDLYDFEFVFKPYKTIPDEQIKISESDYQKYYDEHQYMFIEQKASRDIEYVVFSIIPSAEDTLATLNKIEELYDEFNALEEGHLEFANRYTEHRTMDVFIGKNEELPSGLTENFFDLEEGATSEIIQDGNLFYFARIVEVAQRPDSVMASHILLVPNDSVSIEQCRVKADSLMKMVEDGEEFAILAVMNSEDPGSKNSGGDLGWLTEGKTVKEFNDACFSNKKGDMVIVESQIGVHLIKITDQTKPLRKIKLAILNKEIHSSDRTSNYYFSLASTFAADNTTAKKFDDAIVKNNYVKRIANKLSDLDNKISGIENARNIVIWLYDENTKKGDVSTVFNFPDKYIVAKVSAIREKGVLPLEDVKVLIEPTILNNKKADMIMADFNKELNAKSDLNKIAEKYELNVDTLTNISFSSLSLPGLGIEPNVNGIISTISLNTVSKPIKGNSGVFIVKVFNSVKAPEKTDFSSEQLSSMRNYASQTYKIFGAIEKKAEISDFRAKYF